MNGDGAVFVDPPDLWPMTKLTRDQTQRELVGFLRAGGRGRAR